MIGARRDLQRVRDGHGHHRVTYIELFFDLVFVFAITQLSHGLLHHLTPLGAFQAALLFLAVWWVWIYTCWITNWLDPERPAVRLLLLALMLAGLVMSMSLPEAFEDKGLTFAIAFVLMQVGRSLFVAWALRRHNARNYRNFLRITAWLAVSGACWIAGGLSEGPQRMALWGLAVAIEFASPSLGFWTPGLGRSTTADWDVEGGHMAERCALFVIIALGETLLMTGATVAELPREAGVLTAFGAAFAASVAMWWIYFDTGSERAAHHFEHAADRGRVARNAYTYLHIPIIAGIVLCAVADELVLVHPDHATDAGILVILGGPLVYLLGNMLFKWTTNTRRTPPLSHMAGVALLLLLAIPAAMHLLSALALGALTSAVLVLVAAWEWIALRRG